MKIKLNTVSEAGEFVKVCSHYDFDIDARYGRHCVDAKSIMALIAIGLEHIFDIVAISDDAEATGNFTKECEIWSYQ